LCPRKCLISPDDCGFCKARYNEAGILKTAIWGKLIMPSIEPIETEAVYHYWPGAKILSIGNLGCNLECAFCQNWESSDIENIVHDDVYYYTPEQIIDLAKTLNVNVISFAYNDPAIWVEYVMETAQLAKANSIKTLYKSAGYNNADVIKRLTEVIDIFSMSIKTINPVTFSKISKGILEPVLEGVKIIHASGRHLEVSNLIVIS